MAHYTPGGNFVDDHAETQMQDRHITDLQVDTAIQHGMRRPGNVPGRTEHHYAYTNRSGRRMCLLVVTVNGTNTVVTTFRHSASRHRWS